MRRLPDLMYFGNKERMTWVRAPGASFAASKDGWGNTTQFLNGGAYVKGSTASHKTYDLSWNMMSRDEIRAITDYRDGVYGNGAIYFLDPMAMDRNLLPQHWATPRQQLEDAPTFTGTPNDSVIPYAATLTNSLGYPSVGVGYSGAMSMGGIPPVLYVPIPPGYTAWFGVHGVLAGSNVSGFSVVTSAGGAVVPPMLSVNDVNRFSNSFEGNSYSYITITFTGIGSPVPAGLMLQILPTGVVPAQGGFISGQGNGGVHFEGQPSLTNVSAALDRASLTATFTEDELWR